MIFLLTAVVITVLACLIVSRAAAAVVGRMAPAQAVPLLTLTALALSLATGSALTAVAAAVIVRLGSVAGDENFSAQLLHHELPIPVWLGAAAAVAVVTLLTRALVRTGRIVFELIQSDRLCRNMRAGGGPIVMVDQGNADAFTVAGLRGCVVISRRLFAQLNPDERRALTGHELSHLNRRHHLYVQLADVAAAANPLLATVSEAVRFGVERWADEDSAAGVGDRRITGRALARVALLRSALATGRGMAPLESAVPVLGAVALQVAARVQALLQPAPQRRAGRLIWLTALALGVLALGLASLDHLHEAIEAASPLGHR